MTGPGPSTPEPSHERIEREAWVERYHRGDLTPDEEALFEEHFFTCPRCRDALEAAKDFQDGLRDVASHDAARAVGLAAGAGLLRRATAGPGRRWLWAAALFLLVALPGWWLLFRDDPAGERVTQGPAAVERPADPGSLVDPVPASLPVFLLTTLRGGGYEPATVISATEAAGPLSLAVDAGGDDPLGAAYDAYRVTIATAIADTDTDTDTDGATLFRRDGLQPNALEVIQLTFPAGFLPPGDHELVLEGTVEGSEAEEIGRYRFRVDD
jgi:hypothetical protein